MKPALSSQIRWAWPPGWVWTALLGLGMMIGGLLAALVAVTRVVLPYDEAFVGMSRTELAALNPQLLPFMTHDRISLAGVMLSIGVLYLGLAVGPIRAGDHWAWETVRISGAVGFATFFLFLGFGYFDPLHALSALLLLPLFLFGLRRPPESAHVRSHLRRLDARSRRLGAWGRLLFIAIGIGLVGAGMTIAGLGITSVFVPSDLAFMDITPEGLREANPRLIPLIAHDRAGFGGALVSDGLGVLLVALWGFRPGARALWWTLLGAGIPGFLATLGIHFVVGYTDWLHLLPAVLAFIGYVLALLLSYPYLFNTKAEATLRSRRLTRLRRLG